MNASATIPGEHKVMADVKLPLCPGQVQIWKVPLPLPNEAIARLNAWLSHEERERIAKFRFLKDRQRFISARGALRVVLASYLDARPVDLAFEYGPFGKPALAGPAATADVAFSLSHCNDLALIAVASCPQLGIDVEGIREVPELAHIVERYFSNEERTAIKSAATAARSKLFLQLWTRREAAAKARGLDLSAALSDLGIPLYAPGSGACFAQVGQDGWWLQDLDLASAHVAAVCAHGRACTLTLRVSSFFLESIAD
jgi:4'-phosphopantetheinyl transferase